ncbi:MAG: response regulator [Elusimicrobiota bacterium]|jgi:DNA-binding response OmpR family regulator
MYRILLIEDDPIIQSALQEVLRQEGFELLQAGDGARGLALAAAEKPDLVLLDIHLPDTTGFEVCRVLKSGGTTRHIPVVILSGQARETADRVSGLDLGADDYLLKPIASKVLVARIRALLRISAKPS